MVVIDINTDADFATEMAKTDGKVAVVDFWASWYVYDRFMESVVVPINLAFLAKILFSRCGPCRNIAPAFLQMSNNYPTVVFMKVNVDKCQVNCDFVDKIKNFRAPPLPTASPPCPRSSSSSRRTRWTRWRAPIRKHSNQRSINGREWPAVLTKRAILLRRDRSVIYISCSPQFTSACRWIWWHNWRNRKWSVSTRTTRLVCAIFWRIRWSINKLFNKIFQESSLKSDADAQLIINLPFLQPMRVHSLVVKAPTVNGPKQVKIFINQPRTLDFDDAEASDAKYSLVWVDWLIDLLI